jgi:large subunit ribosomal protein L29
MAKGAVADELRTLPETELVAKLKEAKEELFNLRFQSATGQLGNHSRLRVVKREIARIYTVMRERELGIYEIVEVPVEDEEPAAVSASGDTTEDTDE